MQLSPQQMEELAEKCLKSLTKEDANFAMLAINVQPEEVIQSLHLKTYFLNIVRFLQARDKLKNWLLQLSTVNQLTFAKEWLQSYEEKKTEGKESNKNQKVDTSYQLGIFASYVKSDDSKNTAGYHNYCGVVNSLLELLKLDNLSYKDIQHNSQVTFATIITLLEQKYDETCSQSFSIAILLSEYILIQNCYGSSDERLKSYSKQIFSFDKSPYWEASTEILKEIDIYFTRDTSDNGVHKLLDKVRTLSRKRKTRRVHQFLDKVPKKRKIRGRSHSQVKTVKKSIFIKSFRFLFIFVLTTSAFLYLSELHTQSLLKNKLVVIKKMKEPWKRILALKSLYKEHPDNRQVKDFLKKEESVKQKQLAEIEEVEHIWSKIKALRKFIEDYPNDKNAKKSFQYAQEIYKNQSEGLIGYWSGNNELDSSGFNNHGELMHGAKLTKGKFGSAFIFDGVNDGFYITKQQQNFDNLKDFTISAWIKFSSLQTARNSAILYNYSGNAFWGLFIDQKGKAMGAIRKGSDLNTIYIKGQRALNDNKWHQLVLVRNGSNITLFVDNRSVAKEKFFTGSIDINIQFLTIGGAYTSSGYKTLKQFHETPFKGIVDEVKVYNKALKKIRD
ncbi:LamG domain-containing protein [Candidatus Uabimicrobium sp. HlEnr_7]|uniref:LamG domain-containing protein n=1 Tax=Candidatus Uabimicrobium helgolandensis TaxID=3095367 RepID=UPI0035560EBA